jgi:hypothetical protein
MFAPTIQRKVSWLAFAAMVLLMVMPTTGRLLAGVSGGAWGPNLQHPGMTMPAGMTPDDAIAPGHGGASGADHHGGAMPHGDGICPYCPLLGTMAVPLPHFARVPPGLPGLVLTTRATAAAPTPVFGIGLGPRGPPSML